MLDCFISTVCLERHEKAGRGEVIRECIPSVARKFPTQIFNFGSHERQRQWLLDSFRNHGMFFRIWQGNPYQDLPWELNGSERSRFIFSERAAETDIYVLSDDDCLPLTPDWASEGERILREHPQFGMLVLSCKEIGLSPAPNSYQDDDVFEMQCVGGIRFIRKGVVKEFPDYMGFRGYDAPICWAHRQAGYKVGMFRNLWMSHLGVNCSVVREVNRD